ncbi:MAG: class I tRNA ligase family protein, partial [Cyclobacteriaceae bacterium]
FVVAETLELAIQLASEASCRQLKEEDLHQDEDVLDTWASSWLFPLAVFDGFKDEYFNKEAGTLLSGKNKELDYFYPTDTLVTAPEILFFWVARMIIAGYEYTGQKPFKQVYLTGIVRDKLRRKMSKSLGNSPDPLDLIAKYGADGVRTGMLFSSPAGNDLLFDEKLVEQGRNFANKIWNAFRLIKSWKISDIEAPSANLFAVKWMIERTNEGLTQLEDHFSKFRMSDALMTIYKLIWNDFCSWYLEWIKPSYGAPIDKKTYNASVNIFSRLMRALHPFMPFITEELWHNINEEETQTPIIISEWPEPKSTGDDALLRQGDLLFEIVQNVRNLRNTKQISPKESLKLVIHAPAEDFKDLTTSLQKLANLSEVKCSSTQPENAFSFVLRSIEYFLESPNTIDAGAEKEALEKELSYAEGFLKSVDKKLSNERFVNNAPAEVVEVEKKKKADTETKIQSIKEAIKKLGS